MAKRRNIRFGRIRKDGLISKFDVFLDSELLCTFSKVGMGSWYCASWDEENGPMGENVNWIVYGEVDDYRVTEVRKMVKHIIREWEKGKKNNTRKGMQDGSTN